LRAGSRFLAWNLARVIHFFPLPTTGEPVCARTMPPATRKSHPQGTVREPCPASLAIVAGLRASKLPDCIESAGIANEPRMNSTTRHNRYCANRVYTCVTRLKRRTSCPSGSGGAGVRHVARFFPIINNTPMQFFRHKPPYLATPRLTHIVARLTGH
jgi:hypothetical protein